MRRRIERNPARWSAWLTVAGLGAAYLAMTGTLITRRVLWNDELFTYYIAVRPTLRDVWHTLLTGAEQLPPFFYAVTRSGIAIFGLSTFSLRISEMFGVGVAALTVYWFSARRTSSVCATAGAIFLLCTAAYEYAYEARPYGLVLGFSGLALVAWQRATENSERRGIALGGLALMLTAAVHTHYYAALVLGPLCASEFARSFVRRRLDLPVWVSLFLPLVTLMPLAPLLRAASRYAGSFWSLPSWPGILDTYQRLISSAVPALVLLAIVAAMFKLPESPVQSRRLDPPLHELIAIGCLALLPLEEYGFAKIITHAFTMRYVLPTTLAVAILVAWGLDWAIGDRPRVSVLATLLLGTCFVANFVHEKNALRGGADNLRDVCRFLEATDQNLTVVIAAPHTFFEISHYAPPGLKARLTYLADVQIATDRTETDTPERGLIALKEIAPLRVIGYREFLKSGRPFLVYANPGPYSWVVQQLAEDGRRIEVSRARGDIFLFLVN